MRLVFFNVYSNNFFCFYFRYFDCKNGRFLGCRCSVRAPCHDAHKSFLSSLFPPFSLLALDLMSSIDSTDAYYYVMHVLIIPTLLYSHSLYYLYHTSFNFHVYYQIYWTWSRSLCTEAAMGPVREIAMKQGTFELDWWGVVQSSMSGWSHEASHEVCVTWLMHCSACTVTIHGNTLHSSHQRMSTRILLL